MKHLFIDDHELEEIDNLARKLHQPHKFRGNAVVRPENRWENCVIEIRTTPAWDPEEGLFKMLYQSGAEGPDPNLTLDVTGAPAGEESFMCLATSEDGVNWEKPNLGLFDYHGVLWNGKPIGKENNIVGVGRSLFLAPIYDGTDPDPSRRYKGMGWWAGGSGGLTPVVSSDCLHWSALEDFNVPSSDEAHLTHLSDEKRFVAMVKNRGPGGRAPYGRSHCLSISEDFENWSELELVFHADQEDQENGMERIARFIEDPEYLSPVYNRPEEYRTDVYNFPVFKYEGLYLGLPVMHHWTGKHAPLYANVDSRKSVELTSSRDLRNWERSANRAPFLELSKVGDGSAYDTGQVVVTNGPVVRNNELWFYYLACRHRSQSIEDTLNRKYLDTAATCMARLRMDGFVSLKGGVEWGSVLTKPIEVTGERLHINVDSWRGKVTAEVLDASSSEPIAGYTNDDAVPAVLDNIDHAMSWKDKTDLSGLRGCKVRLRFSLWNGELYSYWFE